MEHSRKNATRFWLLRASKKRRTNSQSDYGTDHKLVTSIQHIKLNKKTKPRYHKFDWSDLQANTKMVVVMYPYFRTWLVLSLEDDSLGDWTGTSELGSQSWLLVSYTTNHDINSLLLSACYSNLSNLQHETNTPENLFRWYKVHYWRVLKQGTRSLSSSLLN